MNVTTNSILVAMMMISVTKWVGVFTQKPGNNARQNFSFKGAQIFQYWYNDHKTIFAHNRGDMHCIKSHIHFQVSPSTSEKFNKNLKIGRFYPGLPYRIGIHGSSTVLFWMVLRYWIARMFNSFVPSRSMIRFSHGSTLLSIMSSFCVLMWFDECIL